MSKYRLTVTEKAERTHEVIIETDKDIDAICNAIESGRTGIGDVWDIQYIRGVNNIEVEEGAEDIPDFEVVSVEPMNGEENE